MRKYLLSIIVFSVCIIPVANSQTIKGKVLFKNDHGEFSPLIGANIVWVGTSTGCVTDANGEFSTNKPDRSSLRLIISFVGFKNDTIALNPDQIYVEHTMQNQVELEEVIIRKYAKGTHFDRLSPIQTQVVSQNELKRAACCNLSESFETNASVDVSYSDAVTGAKQIQLLGLAGAYTQLQAENIPILRGLGSTFGLSQVPGSWMESIQISKGTASVANGYESITGQINIEYKKPWGEEKLFINSYVNGLGMFEANANYAVDVSDNLSTMLLYHSENFGRNIDHNMDSFLDHPKVSQHNLFNRWKYQHGNLEAQIGIKYLIEDRLAGQVGYKNRMDNVPGNPYGIDVNTSRIEAFSKVGYIFSRPSTTIGWIMSASGHDQKSVFGLNDYNANQKSFFTNLIFITYLGNTNHTIKSGLSFAFDKYDEKLNLMAFDKKEGVPGAYFEYTYKYIEKVTLMTGIRYDFNSRYGSIVTPRVHFRYQPVRQITFRGSLGKGYRSPNVLSENSYLFASSRQFIFEDEIKMEQAWNFGLNVSQKYIIFDRELTLNTDYYRTDFTNQLIIDLDKDPSAVYFYNLKGDSYSNSFQVELNYQPINRFDVTMAYRINDVKSTINGQLKQKPLVSKYKGLISLGYKTPLKKWQFDYTIQLNGGGRLPNTMTLPVDFQQGNTFKPYILMNAQVTKYFRKWEMYVGAENITGFTQHNPIISASDPYSPYFDATMVWGPITGRMFYAGFRILVWK